MTTSSTLKNIRIVSGDITKIDAEAYVNAANDRMLGGGGVDGSIHRAAGPELREYCESLKEVRPGIRCQTGDAIITSGYKLKAKYVIHAVGPVYSKRFPERCAAKLASAYRSALHLVLMHNIRSVAVPCISTGVYGFPFEPASHVAVKTVTDWIKINNYDGELIFSCFEQKNVDFYEKLLAELEE